MAESDHRSYRDPAAARSASTLTRDQPDDPLAGLTRLIGPTPTRDQPDDTLAGLARLIDQTLITNDLPSDARGPIAAGSRSAREFNPPAQHGYAAPEPNGTHDEELYEPLPRADVFPQSRSTWYEREPADPHVEASGVRYRDCEEDRSHDHSDDHADGDDYDEHPIPRRRDGFIFVAAVFGLALLGAAGAFAYRVPFVDSIAPSLLSIIKAEGGPRRSYRPVPLPKGTFLPKRMPITRGRVSGWCEASIGRRMCLRR